VSELKNIRIKCLLEGKSVPQVTEQIHKFILISKYGFMECYISQRGKNLLPFGGTYRLHLQVTRLNYIVIHDQMQVQGKTTRICSGRIEEKGTGRGNDQINQGRWRLKFVIQKEQNSLVQYQSDIRKHNQARKNLDFRS
jgi:hypothetical protein